MSYRVTAIEPRANFRIWVRFQDGTEGEVDLSDIAGRGVFKHWVDYPQEFAAVSIDPVSGAPTWPGGLDVAPDRLYEDLVGQGAVMKSRRGAP
ncbi:MAG: DUF2442 domain-containing protein [Gemmatimonadetes bacterium]|nr:DUF2442 domain-containing protein [Gemmatimonadota bacterium]